MALQMKSTSLSLQHATGYGAPFFRDQPSPLVQGLLCAAQTHLAYFFLRSCLLQNSSLPLPRSWHSHTSILVWGPSWNHSTFASPIIQVLLLSGASPSMPAHAGHPTNEPKTLHYTRARKHLFWGPYWATCPHRAKVLNLWFPLNHLVFLRKDPNIPETFPFLWSSS